MMNKTMQKDLDELDLKKMKKFTNWFVGIVLVLAVFGFCSLIYAIVMMPVWVNQRYYQLKKVKVKEKDGD